MKQYLLITLQCFFSVLILALDIANIIPDSVLPYLLTAMFCILICDLAYEAVISIINVRFFNSSIYICFGALCIIFITDIKEALICLLILRIFKLILHIFCKAFNAKLKRLTQKLLPKKARLYITSDTEAQTASPDNCNPNTNTDEQPFPNIFVPCNELKPGDTIVLYPSEVLPVDCALLDSRALFAPVFAASDTTPTEFLQGDDIPSGFRLMSETPVTLHVSAHYDNSTFTKYIHAFEACSNESSESILGLFFDKLQLYSFQKGVLISKNIKKLAKTKAFYIDKSAIIKSSEYSITSICPAKSSMDNETLLKYAAQAEIPYVHTGIGSTLIKEYPYEVLLSAVNHTEQYPGLGITTKYKNDTIHAGCKEFLKVSGISKLPDFVKIESGFSINDTFIYIALNNSYIGYITLHAPFKNSYNDFLKYTNKKKLLTTIALHNSPDEEHSLVTTKQQQQKKCRTSYVAYIDSKPTDSTLQSMSDYNIFIGSGVYCPENDFCDVTIIPNSFKTLLRTIILAKKVYFTVNIYAALLLFIKATLIIASFLLPGINMWHALLADGIISTVLIKVYDLLFRLFTRFN